MFINKNNWLLFFLFFTILNFFSQNSINATGIDVETDQGSICYSIGQLNYTLNEGGSGSVALGIHQTYEIFQFNGDLNYMAYPNPTSNSINIAINSDSLNELYYSLSDTHGRKILSDINIVNEITTIYMEHLQQGIYFVHVYSLKDTFQTFKIIKN